MCRNHVDILKAKTIGEGDAPSSYFSATRRTSHWGCTASPPNRLTQGETTRGVGCLICLQGRGAFIPAPPSTSVGVFSDPFMVSCCCLMVSELCSALPREEGPWPPVCVELCPCDWHRCRLFCREPCSTENGEGRTPEKVPFTVGPS